MNNAHYHQHQKDHDDEQKQDKKQPAIVGNRRRRNNNKDDDDETKSTTWRKKTEDNGLSIIDDDDDDPNNNRTSSVSTTFAKSKVNVTQTSTDQNQTTVGGDDTTVTTALAVGPAAPEGKKRKKPDGVGNTKNQKEANSRNTKCRRLLDIDSSLLKKKGSALIVIKSILDLPDDPIAKIFEFVSSLLKKKGSALIVVKSILDLPDDPIAKIFEFVGPGDFLYIAGVCKKFCTIYKLAFSETKIITTEDKDNNDDDHQNKKKKDSFSSRTDDNDTKTKTMTIHNNDTPTSNKKEKDGKTMLVPYTKTFTGKMVGSISRVQLLLKGTVNKRFLFSAAQLAALYGQIQVLDYIMEQQPTDVVDSDISSLWEDNDIVDDVREVAAKYGQLQVLKHTVNQTKFAWKIGPLWIAVAKSQIDTVKWLLKDTDSPRDDDLCNYAATKGNVDLLKCLVASGCPYDKEDLIFAATRKGQLEIIKYARLELNCPWNRDGLDIFAAAKHGHLHCFQWLIENGCPFNRSLCRVTAEGHGHTDIVRWIDENHHDVV